MQQVRRRLRLLGCWPTRPVGKQIRIEVVSLEYNYASWVVRLRRYADAKKVNRCPLSTSGQFSVDSFAQTLAGFEMGDAFLGYGHAIA